MCKGNMMLATKLDTVLKSAKASAASAPSPSAAPSASAPSATVSSVAVDGFESSAIFTQMKAAFSAASAAEKEALLKKGKGIFQFDIKVLHFSMI